MKKLLIFIIVLIIAYLGYNYWQDNKIIPDTVDNAPNNAAIETVIWQTYYNNSYAVYSIQHPNDWQVASSNLQTLFTSPNKNEQVAIYLQETGHNQDATQTTATIGEEQVIIFESTKDDEPIKYVVFNLDNDKKLEVAGYGETFEQMLGTININSNQPTEEQIELEQTDTDAEVVIDEEEQATEPEENIPDEATDKEEEFVIKLFYPTGDRQFCAQVFGYQKEIDTRYNTDEINALVSLVEPISNEDNSNGMLQVIPADTRLRRLGIVDTTATAEFNAPLADPTNGECDLEARHAMITQTLLQFPDIDEVIITVDGQPFEY